MMFRFVYMLPINIKTLKHYIRYIVLVYINLLARGEEFV